MKKNAVIEISILTPNALKEARHLKKLGRFPHLPFFSSFFFLFTDSIKGRSSLPFMLLILRRPRK